MKPIKTMLFSKIFLFAMSSNFTRKLHTVLTMCSSIGLSHLQLNQFELWKDTRFVQSQISSLSRVSSLLRASL